MKKCTKCGVEKDLSLFYRDKKSPDGKTIWCSDCMKIQSRAYAASHREEHREKAKRWAKGNPERRKENRRRYYAEHKEKEAAQMSSWYQKNKAKKYAYDKKRFLKLYFNLSVEDYESMYKAQNGVCAICSDICTSGRRLAVDHCHKTGVIRGLLCGRCNTGLGWFKDRKDLLEKAIEYLDKSKVKESV